MRLPEFRTGEGGMLSHVTPQQIRSMLNDQILMLMHHVEAYHSGHESAAKATRSLAKYAERALLALSLLGQFHPDQAGQYSGLFTATRALMRYKDNPEALIRTLQEINPGTRGDVAASLRWYLDQIESIPGMAGLTRSPADPSARLPFDSTVARREWERLKQAARRSGTLPELIAREVIGTLTDLERIERELARLTTDRELLSGDRHRASLERVRREEDRIRLVWLSGQTSAGPRFAGELWKSLQAGIYTTTATLSEMRQRWVDAGSPVDADLERRIGELERQRDGLRERQRDLEADIQALQADAASR